MKEQKKSKTLKDVVEKLIHSMRKLKIEPHPAEKPLPANASTIRFVPGEVLLHTFALGNLRENQLLLLSRVSKRFHGLIADGRLLLQSPEVREDIGEFIADEKSKNTLFESQAEEIDYLLDNEASIYDKNHGDEKIKDAFDQLKTVPQKKEYYSLYIRHKALNHINTCIIFNCLQSSQLDNIFILSDLYLTRLPAKLINDPKLIGFWSNLTMLDVEDNRIRKLPDCISKLVNLRQLWVSNNQLRELPSSIGSISTLKLLKASGNFILSLANIGFDQMANLESIVVSDNQLLEIPTINAPKLKTLYISGNYLLSLPSSLPEKVLIMVENGGAQYVSKEKILASQKAQEKGKVMKIC